MKLFILLLNIEIDFFKLIYISLFQIYLNVLTKRSTYSRNSMEYCFERKGMHYTGRTRASLVARGFPGRALNVDTFTNYYFRR